MRFTHALRAISLATIVSIAALAAFSAPVAATDPIPGPAADPSAVIESPSPEPTATATPDPSATADPAAPADPPADATPSPDATPEPVSAAVPATVAVVKPKPNLRARIVRIALAQRHKAYVRGGVGPRGFDCSGLVRYVFRKAGVSKYLGGGHSARSMYKWAVRHHLTSRKHPRIGDVVVWGRGSHVGIYIGHGKVISALNPRQDIRVTRLHALRAPFTTFIHVRI